MFFFSPAPQKTSNVVFLSRTAMTQGGTNATWYSNVAYPTPHTERLLVGVVHWETGNVTPAVSSVTVDGVAATIHVAQTDQGGGAGGTGMGIAIFSVKIANTSGNTVITYNLSGTQAANQVACHMYSVFNLQNTTPFSTSTILGHAVIPASNTLNICANGIIIAGATGSTNTVTSNAQIIIPGVTLSNAYSNNSYNGSVVGNYAIDTTANTATWVANTQPTRQNVGIVAAAIVLQGNF